MSSIPLRDIFGAGVRIDDIIPVLDAAKDIGEEFAEKRKAAQQIVDARALTEAMCACKKMKPLAEMPLYNTGFIMAVDNVCFGCRNQWKDFARIVCKNCKLPEMFVSPHEDKSGFRFERGRTYHITACLRCCPELKIMIPVEKIAFDHRKSGSNIPLREFMRLCLKNP